MAYRIHYVFCGAAFEFDQELKTFHHALAEFNAAEAMPRGELFAALEITMQVPDKRPFQGAINDNIRMSRHYIQMLEDSWGPPQRDFERDWALAQKCLADPSLPMTEAVMFFRAPLLPHKVDPAIVELKGKLLEDGGPHACFDGEKDLDQALRRTFSRWLASVPAEIAAEPCLS